MSLKDSVNRANPNTLADFFRSIALGSFLQGQTIQVRNKIDMDARGTSPQTLATLDCLQLPDGAKCASIVRATVRAGGVTGELTPKLYGVTPATTEIGVAPNGDIVSLGTDAITDLDLIYIPYRGEVLEAFFPVTTGVLTIPAAYTARGVMLLMEAEAVEGTVLGKKGILVPGAAPATTKANLNVAKTQVLFNVATDVVTRARVKLLIAPAASRDFTALMEGSETLV